MLYRKSHWVLLHNKVHSFRCCLLAATCYMIFITFPLVFVELLSDPSLVWWSGCRNSANSIRIRIFNLLELLCLCIHLIGLTEIQGSNSKWFYWELCSVCRMMTITIENSMSDLYLTLFTDFHWNPSKHRWTNRASVLNQSIKIRKRPFSAKSPGMYPEQNLLHLI